MRLIEQAWYQNHPLKWLLLPLSGVFWLLASIRKLLFKFGIKHQESLDIPVVIVGNIGVGGNGKTPVVVFLIEALQAKGINVGVISRGYGGSSTTYPLQVTDTVGPEIAGDEPVLIYQRTKVPVVVSPKRVAGVKLLQELGCQLVISDDGLQHYALKRDVELVVVDGNRRFGNGFLMPAGPLRETQARLNSVDFVICNGGQAHQNELSMTLVPDSFVNVVTGQSVSIERFKDEFGSIPCHALAGIGDPQRFFNTLSQLEIELESSKGFVDHHHFSVEDFNLYAEDEVVLMTEKDAVKCQPFAQQNWWYLSVSAQFDAQNREQIITLIEQRSKK